MNVFSRFALGCACLVALLSASASAKEPKASKELLVGVWTGTVEVDEEALKTDEKFKEVPAEQAGLVLNLVKQQFSEMKIRIKFGQDGQAKAEFDAPNTPGSKTTQTGAWEVVKSDGPSITVKITPAANDKDGDKDDEDDADEDEEEVAEKTKKDGPEEMTFRFESETTMTAADLGDKLPKGVTFKFTKK